MTYSITFTFDSVAEYEAVLHGVSISNVTKGRPKRKRRPGSGSAVGVKRHTRSPRGPNRGKSRVVVDPYKRGKPPKRRKRK